MSEGDATEHGAPFPVVCELIVVFCVADVTPSFGPTDRICGCDWRGRSYP